MLSWFDLVAVQEVNDDLEGLRVLVRAMGAPYRVVFSDNAGNSERLAFIYDSSKLAVGELIAEVAVPAAEKKHIKITDVNDDFARLRSPPLREHVVSGHDSVA